jgi:hypothetical protein
MPLHDHPNMCVFFRMMFGRLNYRSYDKVDEKFKYNKFSLDEYQELLAQKKRIGAKLSTQTILSGPQFMMVRPSKNNLHEFVAEENTCFFDICLPIYTADSLRRITYFKEIAIPPASAVGANEAASASAALGEAFDPRTFADCSMQLSSQTLMQEGFKVLEYDSTPPKLPVNFEVADLPYRGDFN